LTIEQRVKLNGREISKYQVLSCDSWISSNNSCVGKIGGL
jgi:hypothetical protein